MTPRHSLLAIAWHSLLDALRLYLSDGWALARCRLRDGGHEFGTWRVPDLPLDGRVAYAHTWCRRCGWCQQTQSFDEERVGAVEGWYDGIEGREV